MSLTLASWPSGIMVWPIAGTSTWAAIACGIAAQFARIAHSDAEPFPAFDGGGNGLGPKGHRNHLQEIADGQPIPRQGHAVRFDIEVIPAGGAFRVHAGSARHRSDR